MFGNYWIIVPILTKRKITICRKSKCRDFFLGTKEKLHEGSERVVGFTLIYTLLLITA